MTVWVNMFEVSAESIGLILWISLTSPLTRLAAQSLPRHIVWPRKYFRVDYFGGNISERIQYWKKFSIFGNFFSVFKFLWIVNDEERLKRCLLWFPVYHRQFQTIFRKSWATLRLDLHLCTGMILICYNESFSLQSSKVIV